MDDLKRDLKAARTQLGMLVTQVKLLSDSVQGLEGTFASIETHMVKLFEEDAKRKKDIKDLQRRVEALEKKPPAA